MATSIPPHNLGEVIDAAKAYLKDPEITTESLLRLMPGPDFPTGGIVVNKDELSAIYETGMGKIKVRGRVQVEKLKGGKEQLVITEIPYPMIGANIGKFLNDIAALVESKKAPEITDISSRFSGGTFCENDAAASAAGSRKAGRSKDIIRGLPCRQRVW